jgi:hypothetical protein
MSGTEQDLSDLVGELARTTEQLRDELDADGPRLRPPTPSELLRFTTEVTIPAIILALETNVRALRLLQRTLQFASGREPETGGTSKSGQARARAEALGRETLDRLDDALADLQDALAGRPPDDEARELLEETRALRAEVDQRLAGEEADENEAVDIDVDAELQSIKDSVEDEPPDDE